MNPKGFSHAHGCVNVNKRNIVIQVTCAILALLALTYGVEFSVPDAVSISYGFPFNWGVHQLMTIAGPVDIWNINLTNLMVDLGIWLLAIITLPILVDKVLPEK